MLVESQIGVFGVAQSVAELAHPPQAPLVVHLRVPPQLSGCAVHDVHIFVAGAQIGVLPLQPALLRLGSHGTQLFPTHSGRLVLPEQSVPSRKHLRTPFVSTGSKGRC